MKLKIVKCISFILILLIILLILSYIAIPKNNLAEFGMEEVRANGILGERENSIDVLMVGNSESFTSVIPMKLWKDYGITSYVSGTVGQSLPDSCLIVYKVMKKQKPKIVILDADNIYDRVSLATPVTKIAEEILPIIKYHNRWKNLNSKDFFSKINYTWTEDTKGYYDSTLIAEADSTNYMTYSENSSKIPKSNKLYVKLLNEYCKYNNAQLIILSTPSTMNWNYENYNGIKKFAEEENIEFLDLNIVKDEIKIDWKKDTRDGGDHLNRYGAIKATEYLGNYLNKKNILEDHREDDKFNDWNEALKRCKEKINVKE